MTGSPFDHRPDLELGAALREALATSDDARFAERVIAAAEAVQGDLATPWWAVLTAWARPGLAAALLMIAAAGFWLGAMTRSADQATTALGDPLIGNEDQVSVPALLAGQQAPDVDYVLAVALGN
jgi:hypothetical protein